MLTRGSPTADALEPEPEPVESPGEPLGVLIARDGKTVGSEYNVGASPVSIGSGARCGVRVDDSGMAAEEARTWVRKGHLMVHKMTRLTTLVADGTSGGWQILQPGDTFTVGAHTFEFRLLPQAETPLTPPIPADAEARLAAPPEQRPSPFTGLMPRND
jgi:hypothetical protein